MAKFKVGDKVRVKRRSELFDTYGGTSDPRMPFGWTDAMDSMCGNTYFITSDETENDGLKRTGYKLDGRRFVWHVDALMLIEPCKEIKDTTEDKGEMNMFGLDFGKVKKGEYKISQYGLAVAKADGKYVSYDAKEKCLIDVSLLNFDASKFMFRMPVAMDRVEVGDVLIVDGKTVAIHEILDNGHLRVMDYRNASVSQIVPTKNMFGFNYYTKLVNMFSDNLKGSASATQPFGNMLPLMMMGDDVDPMMLMMMQGGQLDMSNPMMMMALMDKKDSKDSMMQMMMMQQFMSQAKTKTEA